ncbi:MAG: hypothetical protein KDA78_21910 [Planctomycetaceae bacterium]|nr:hypothetical protein [Planctomycetaceae bacterium]
MQLVISPQGELRTLYDETLDLSPLGPLSIQRGSHVEPTTDGRWTADLAPVNGPLLGPYRKRSQALLAEQEWLLQHWLIPATD